MINSEEIRRLQWRCRRGLLELDVLLEKFLADKYSTLSPADQVVFVRLLECADPDLLSWLMGDVTPEALDFRRMVGLVRDH
jgi:antitoxin CptB